MKPTNGIYIEFVILWQPYILNCFVFRDVCYHVVNKNLPYGLNRLFFTRNNFDNPTFEIRVDRKWQCVRVCKSKNVIHTVLYSFTQILVYACKYIVHVFFASSGKSCGQLWKCKRREVCLFPSRLTISIVSAQILFHIWKWPGKWGHTHHISF